MPHKDFDAATRALDITHDPITFTFGGEHFTVNPIPSIGDTRDLKDAPEPTPETEEAAKFALIKFIRRMLVNDAERERWDQALYNVPATKSDALISIAGYIAEEATTFPTKRRRSSSAGRRRDGRTSKPRTAGTVS